MIDRPAPPALRLVPSPAPLPPVPPLAPVVPTDRPISLPLERRLTRLARAAQQGDREARDTLWAAFGPKVRILVIAAARRAQYASGGRGLRRDGRLWDQEDLAQEAFPIFLDLIAAWPGHGPIGPYLLSHLNWRLRTAARALAQPRRREGGASAERLAMLADESAAAAEALALLDALAASFPATDAEILRRHIGDGESLTAIARQLGLNRRTVGRHWQRIRRELQPRA